MFALHAELRPRASKRKRHSIGLWTEALEARVVLDATPTNAASIFNFAIGLPVAGLETGIDLAVPVELESDQTFESDSMMAGANAASGLATPAQPMQMGPASVSPPTITSTFPGTVGSAAGVPLFGSTATGPSTTLNPLGYDSATANAAASQVARPTPGITDRVSGFLITPKIVPLSHLRSPSEFDINPDKSARGHTPAKAPLFPARPLVEPAKPFAPAAPVQAAPAEPIAPVHPIDAAPAEVPVVPKAAPTEMAEPLAFHVWDAAIEFVATDSVDNSSASLADHTEGSMAVGALLAAWGGWNSGKRLEGRSRRRPIALVFAEAGPGDGASS